MLEPTDFQNESLRCNGKEKGIKMCTCISLQNVYKKETL